MEDLDGLRVTTPCARRWDQLAGRGARRYCGDCRLQVHDLSALDRTEARELLARRRRGERVCVTYLPGLDGTPLTRDELPVKTDARTSTGHRRVAAFARRVRALVALLSAGVPLVAACGRAPEPPEPGQPNAPGEPRAEREAARASEPVRAERACPCPACRPPAPVQFEALRSLGY
jgi:hypothetical protein